MPRRIRRGPAPAKTSLRPGFTLVEDMVRKGAISAEEAVHHRWRHVITSTVGGESAKVRIDVHRLHLQPGDAVLLCSDGLTEMQTGDQIAAILQAATDPTAACSALIDAANAAELDPDRLSLTNSLRIIQAQLPEALLDSSATWYARLVAEVSRQRLRPRRNRIYPRVVKRRVRKWPKKQAHHLKPPQPTKPFADSIVIA